MSTQVVGVRTRLDDLEVAAVSARLPDPDETTPVAFGRCCDGPVQSGLSRWCCTRMASSWRPCSR